MRRHMRKAAEWAKLKAPFAFFAIFSEFDAQKCEPFKRINLHAKKIRFLRKTNKNYAE